MRRRRAPQQQQGSSRDLRCGAVRGAAIAQQLQAATASLLRRRAVRFFIHFSSLDCWDLGFVLYCICSVNRLVEMMRRDLYHRWLDGKNGFSLVTSLITKPLKSQTRNLFGLGKRRHNNRAEPVVKGFVSPKLAIPKNIQGPEYALSGKPADAGSSIYIHNAQEIPKLRKSAKLARKVLEFALSHAKPGVSTDAIDRIVHEEILRNGAYPSPMNYLGFPKSICTSVNEVVCHGIPDSRILKDGDIISIDVSLYMDGFHGDNCGTVVVGSGDPKLNDLIQSTKDAVEKAITVCKPGK